jgi:cell division protease FtsH
MVCEWGMSDDLGPLTYGKKDEQIFLGKEIGKNRDFSEDTAHQIDLAVRKIIDTAVEIVSTLLEENRDILTRIAEDLLEKETLVLDDFEEIVEKLRPGKYQMRKKKAEPKAEKKAEKTVEQETVTEVQSEETADDTKTEVEPDKKQESSE